MSPHPISKTVTVAVFLALTAPAWAAEDRAAAVAQKVEELRRAYDATPWAADTPQSIGKLLAHEPGACAAFVRRSLRYEPYPGVLRGGRGALAAGGGNSADLCLLLHDLLAGASPAPEMRFAIAELTAQQAQALVDRAAQSPPSRPATAARTGPRPAQSPKPSELAPAEPGTKNAATAVNTRRQLLADLNVAAAQIESALGSAIPRPADPRSAATKAARTHVWLQVRRGDTWLTLDPAAGLPLPANAKQVDRLPDDWNHTIQVTIQVERLEAGKLARETLLERLFPSAAVEGRAVELMVVPADLSVPKMIDPAIGNAGSFFEQAKGFKRFAVTLALPGEKPQEGKSFGTDGRTGAAPAAAGPTGIVAVDPFKRLGRGGRGPDAAAASQLAGLWLTMTVKSPGSPDRTVERALLDRVGPAARKGSKPDIAQAWQDATRVGVALLQRHRVLASVGTVGSVRAGRLAVESALLEQPLLQKALEVEQKRDAKALADAINQFTPPSFPSDLIAVNDSSLALAEARLMGHGVCYVASPNLYVRSETLDLAGGAIISRNVVDVARHELAVLAEPKRLWRTRLLHGLAASELEGRVLDGESAPAASAARSLRAAGAEGTLAVVKSQRDLDAVGADGDVKIVMEGELRDGAALLVSAKPRAAWWRVSRDGHVVAVGADGRGQAVTEGGMILTDVSIPQVKNCMTFVACLNKGVAGGGAMVQTAANCWAEQVKDVAKEVLDNALEQMVGDPFSDLFSGEDADAQPPEPGTITHLRNAPFQEPDEQTYWDLYQQAREELDDLKKKMRQAQEAVEDPLGQLPGVSEGQAAADAGAEIGNALGTRVYLLLTMGHDIARFASKPIAD